MRLATVSSLLLVLLLHQWPPTAGGAVLVNVSTFAANTAGFQFSGAAAFSSEGLDACGVCAGTGSTCAGCDGVPNSGKVTDACDVCLLPSDPAFGTSCAGCDGVPNSGKFLDACGRCACARGSVEAVCQPKALCPDCSGVPGGTKARASCAVAPPSTQPDVAYRSAGHKGRLRRLPRPV